MLFSIPCILLSLCGMQLASFQMLMPSYNTYSACSAFAGFTKQKNKDEKGSSDAYNPAKANYHPVDDACWKHGEKWVWSMR